MEPILRQVKWFKDIYIRYLSRFFDRWAHQTTFAYIGNMHFFTKMCHCQTYQNSKISWQNNGSFLVINCFKNWSFQEMSITNYVPLNWYSSMKKIFRKIRIIFDIENWLWKSEIRIFQSPPAKRTLICQKNIYGKVLFFTQLSCHLMRKLLKKS